MKSFLSENLSRRYAVTGIMTAITRVNIVISHWATDTSTAKSDMIPGIAGDIIVWFKTDMNAPAIRINVIIICLRLSPASLKRDIIFKNPGFFPP